MSSLFQEARAPADSPPSLPARIRPSRRARPQRPPRLVLPRPGVPALTRSFEHKILKINRGNHRFGSVRGTLLFIVSYGDAWTASLACQAQSLHFLPFFFFLSAPCIVGIIGVWVIDD